VWSWPGERRFSSDRGDGSVRALSAIPERKKRRIIALRREAALLVMVRVKREL
jgi:hypothetical protein